MVAAAERKAAQEVVPHGFKQTEIGLIPEDWEVVALSQIAEVTSGKRLPLGRSLQDTRTAHPYIRVADMSESGVDLSNIKYVPEDVFPAISRYRIYTDDLFISVAGTLGIVGTIPNELDGANLTENANRIAPKNCSRDFLKFYLNSHAVQTVIDAIRTVGAQPKLALTRIREFLIPLPPLAEQEAIAGALSDADGAIGAVDRALAKQRAVKQAALHALLRPTTRLPGFSGDWETKTLGELATMQSGGTPLTSNRENFGGSIPWVSISDMTLSGKYISKTEIKITDIGLRSSTARMFPTGSVMFAMYASIGKCCIAMCDISCSQAILGIETKPSLRNEYLYYYFQLKRSFLSSSGQQGTQSNLNKGIVQSLEISLPPLPEQRAIAAVLSDMDAAIAALEARRDKLKAVKQGMMQTLLTGKVRLV